MTLPLGRATRPLRRVTVVVLAAVCCLALGVAAWGYWSTSGSGSASATTGTLNPPTGVAATASEGAVTVSWTAPVAGPSPLGYYVTRTSGGTTTAACGTSPTTLTSTGPCSDTSVPDGSYTYAVTAVRNGWTATSASSPNVSVANPVKLAFTTQPGNGTSQNALGPQPVVAVQDASGNTVTAASASVTLALTSPGSATLTCTANPVTAVSGVATFAGCTVDQSGPYTLTATASGLTSATSTSFTVSAGVASKLVFTTDPGSGTGGTALATQPTVTVRDSFGNTATSSSAPVTLALTTPAGATLACTANPVSAVSGVATFAGCAVDKAGSYTLTATSGGITSATSATFTVSVGAATQLAFTGQPSAGTVSQVAFATQPSVTVRDAGGNAVTTATGSVTLALTTPGGATLACTANPRSPTSGVATFAGCTVDKVGSYTLTATAPGVASATSAAFTITPAAASSLAFTTQPGNGTGGSALTTQPVVTVRDVSGNTVTAASNAVTLTLTTPGGATLACGTNPLSASAGVATYAGCHVDKTGSYTLTAAATGLTSAVSTTFTVTVGAAARLAFTGQPSASTTSQVAFAAQPSVTVLDAGGNTVTTATSTVGLALTTANGASLTCTSTSVAAVSGVAGFAGCKVDKATTYTLTATAAGLTPATSASFAITAGAATKVAFTTQPSAGTGGTALPTQPTVSVQDASGNTVTGNTSTVTLALTTAAGATLTCTPTNAKAAVAGVAAFAGCKVDKPGTYTLTATDGSLTSALSSSFAITVGPASRLAVTTQPSASSVSQVAFASQPTVTVRDAGGNTVTTGSTAVTLSVTGATLTCTSNTVASTSGVATFAGCKVDKVGTYTLTAAATGLTSAASSSFTVTVGAAAQLGFTVAPTTGVNRSASATTGPFTVQLQDSGGNAVTAGTGGVTVALTSTTPSSGNAYFSATQNGTTLTSVSIPSGSSTVSFYFGYTKNAKPVVSATASGLTVATVAVDF